MDLQVVNKEASLWVLRLIRAHGFGFRFGVWGLGFRASGSGSKVQGLGVRGWGFGLRVQSLGFRV